MGWAVGGAATAVVVLVVCAVFWQIRRRHMDRWLPAYLDERSRFCAPTSDKEIHVILCVCDHYEPKAGGADIESGRRRVAAWVEQYPKQFGRFKDSDGRTPRHTFFFPVEEYEKEYLDALAQLCRAGFGEVELHLHHDNDTPEGFREKLVGFKDLLVKEHGLLSRSKKTGAVMYAFIHGNWALCNSRPDGAMCGVNNEIAILLETGCYADFTFPSAPSATQPPIINRIYYACDRPGQPRSHEFPLADGAATDAALLLVQGPLLLDWERRECVFAIDAAAEHRAIMDLAASARAGGEPPGLVLRQAARPRRPRARSRRAPGRADGRISRRPGEASGGESEVSLPLRDGPRDGQSHQGRGTRPPGPRGRGARLGVCFQLDGPMLIPANPFTQQDLGNKSTLQVLCRECFANSLPPFTHQAAYRGGGGRSDFCYGH